jgi:hypothetical protein
MAPRARIPPALQPTDLSLMTLLEQLFVGATLALTGFVVVTLLDDLYDDAPAARFTAAVFAMLILALAIGANA